MSDIEIIDTCEQGSDEWKAIKLGIPSASCFSDVMAGGAGKVRDLYLRKLAGEIITGQPREDFRSSAMDRGNAVEPELRATFLMETGLAARQVAFVRRKMPFGIIGASPDSLIDDDCGVELKSAAPHVLIDILKSDKVPGEHLAQVQGNMLVTGRTSWWIGIGYPGMPIFRRKIQRDNAYLARLQLGLKVFYEELDELVAFIRGYGRR